MKNIEPKPTEADTYHWFEDRLGRLAFTPDQVHVARGRASREVEDWPVAKKILAQRAMRQRIEGFIVGIAVALVIVVAGMIFR